MSAIPMMSWNYFKCTFQSFVLRKKWEYVISSWQVGMILGLYFKMNSYPSSSYCFFCHIIHYIVIILFSNIVGVFMSLGTYLIVPIIFFIMTSVNYFLLSTKNLRRINNAWRNEGTKHSKRHFLLLTSGKALDRVKHKQIWHMT